MSPGAPKCPHNPRTTPAQPPAQPPLEAGGQIGKFRNICAPMLFAVQCFSYTFIVIDDVDCH